MGVCLGALLAGCGVTGPRGAGPDDPGPAAWRGQGLGRHRRRGSRPGHGIPDTIRPGDYRLCTANSVENICIALRVVDSDGIREAQDRREEVFHIVERAKSVDEARARLGDHFGFDDLVCQAILDMQVRRWLGDQRGMLASAVDRIRASLAGGAAPS